MTKKILAISSPGGHWTQLNKICDGLKEKNHHIVYAVPASLFKSDQHQTVHTIVDVSADNKIMLIPCAFQIAYILLKERPNTILSTGAAPGVVAILLGKLFRIKTIWVDSIANVSQLSRSGRLIKKHASIILTQWEHLKDDKAQHHGAIL